MWELPEQKRPFPSRRDLKIAAIGLGVGTFAILWFIAPELSQGEPGVARHTATLATGECFYAQDADIRFRDAVRVVSCDSEDWDWVVLDRFAFPAETAWPGEDGIIEEARRRCPGGWAVVGFPEEAGWLAGERLIHCIGARGTLSGV